MSERDEQIKVIAYLRKLELEKNILTFFAVPNGGSRNKLEAINLKREGVKAGVSDLIIITRDKVLFLEMKQAPKVLKSGKLSFSNSKVSDNQKAFLDTICKSSVCVGAIGYGFESAKNIIDKLLKGK